MALRMGWVLLLVVACGGRTIDDANWSEAVSAGRGGGLATLGGAPAAGGSGNGGTAMMVSGGSLGLGGALTPGGARPSFFGGAPNTGAGGGGNGDARLTKYCAAYCSHYANACPTAVSSAEECRRDCLSSQPCDKQLADALGCALSSVMTSQSCTQFWSALNQTCTGAFEALHACGGALPGADQCQNVGIVQVNRFCLRSALCGMSLYSSNCEASGSDVECTCDIDGIRAFRTSMPASSCGAELGPRCGPVLF